ncbi:hypothetical protein D9M69_496250 [compost metagenome]
MFGIRLSLRQFLIRIDAFTAIVAIAVGVIDQLVKIGPRDPQHPVVETRFTVIPESFKALKRQVEVVAQIRTGRQNVMVATQGLFGDRRDVIATEIERAKVLAVEHPVRPFGQIIVAQIQRLQ